MGFGAVLRGFRAAAAMTQEQLAERSGLSTRAIRNLEQGRTARPHRDSVASLAAALRLTRTDHATLLAAAGHAAPSVPSRCELPPDVPDLVGRDVEVASLTRLLTTAGSRLVVVSGGPGTGRTALAVHVSHQVRDRFPDGQIYMDLDRPDRLPVSADEVLARVLRSLSVEVPATHDERAASVRAELGLRRVLVVLDNVASEAQVRPLLTGPGPSAVLLTSRRSLVALPGAHPVTLGPLAPADAVRLVGDACLPSARAVAEACGRLPVALRIAAEWLAAHPHRTAGDLAALLADDPLTHLAVADLSVRDTIAAHVDELRPDDRHLLAALAEPGGLHTPDPVQHDGLARLTRANLLTAGRRPDPLVCHYVRAGAGRPRLRAAT